MRPVLEVTNITVLDMELRPVAVTPRLTRYGLNFAGEVDLAHAAQSFA